MKRILLLLLLPLLSNCISGGAKSEKRQEQDSIVVTLKEFYTKYISLNLNEDVDDALLSTLKREYLSTNLLTKLNMLSLDYDPIVNSQDFDERWLTEIIIEKADSVENRYTVVLPNNMSTKNNCITLDIINKDGKYFIDEIISLGNKDLNQCRVRNSIIHKIQGTWILNEETPFPYITIHMDSTAYVVVENDQIDIVVKLIKEKQEGKDRYKMILIKPSENLGVGGQRLEWNSFSKEIPVGYIWFDNNTAFFQWNGFYDTNNKQFVYTESQFNRDTSQTNILLVKSLK